MGKHILLYAVVVIIQLTFASKTVSGSKKMTLVSEPRGQINIGLAGSGKATIKWGNGKKDKIRLNEEADRYIHTYPDTMVRTIVITGKNIRELRCSAQRLTDIDVRKNPKLTTLFCPMNYVLTNLDVSKNRALKSLDCSHNKLTSLDISKNKALEELWSFANPLTELDVSKNRALTKLICINNRLTKLDVSHNEALKTLICSSNPLQNLNVNKNRVLTRLNCNSNSITDLDVSNNSALEWLECCDNSLTSLNVSNNKALTLLVCNNNRLTNLDLSQNKALRSVYFNHNHLTALDVTHSTSLIVLDCCFNQFTGAALNALLRTLHNNNDGILVDGKYTSKVVLTRGNYYLHDGNRDESNESTESFDKSIAEDKGWTVICR